ncbi:nuclear transport factor 2 family protein [Polyangium mundeleinium]|uniref:Nuclear transport factor 2 family protein n=1 Tax=Polyangium mundeleinium TaxID=2995306 RepID=A0ABT5EJZ1_9BACT|nr:nuclear transport factor 2 family protein [Polyangium mundeleinium]MDC0742153.1 nuclear transport factor 2 family protein [Polyangium mundeleinium]
MIEQFYRAFQKRDAEGMIACYHPDVVFSDSVFVGLSAAEARGMWRMLCERGKDLTLEFSDVHADDSTGSAHWEARYSFSATGRQVHNVIDASFEFRDGKIVRHTDRFDLGRWTRMALGLPGLVLGWTPFFQNAVRKKARKGLADYMAQNPERAGG